MFFENLSTARSEQHPNVRINISQYTFLITLLVNLFGQSTVDKVRLSVEIFHYQFIRQVSTFSTQKRHQAFHSSNLIKRYEKIPESFFFFFLINQLFKWHCYCYYYYCYYYNDLNGLSISLSS